MLNLITGKQRSGKSYYCVTLIIEYLQKSDRPIFTNLPLNPDKLCDYASFGKFRHPQVYQNYLSRLHLFINLHSKKKLLEYKQFRFRNPDFRQVHKLTHNNIIDDSKIVRFWNYTDANSVILIDELYQYFNALDSNKKDSITVDLRRELLTYSRQHGHFKDDMYLISHNEKDIDVHIRRGCQRLYIVENAKYKNITDKRMIFKGLKWPIQFFIISGYEYGETVHSDRFVRFSKKVIFECYESYNQPETLLKKKALVYQKSTDTHIDNKENVKSFIKNTLPFIVIIIFFIIIGIWGYFFMLKLSKPTTNIVLPKSELLTLQNNNSLDNDFYLVKYISNNCVIFEDDYKLKIGDKINGFEVKKFKKSYCILSYGGGFINVSYNGLRVKDRQETTRERTEVN